MTDWLTNWDTWLIFRHLNFKKCGKTQVFCTFWLTNVLLATAAYNFSTSQLQKVLRDRQFFNILTWKCASRHSGVQFFYIATSRAVVKGARGRGGKPRSRIPGRSREAEFPGEAEKPRSRIPGRSREAEKPNSPPKRRSREWTLAHTSHMSEPASVHTLHMSKRVM